MFSQQVAMITLSSASVNLVQSSVI